MNRVALVYGSEGRLGSAFVTRLRRDGFQVVTKPSAFAPLDGPINWRQPVYLFDFAWCGDPTAHISRVVAEFDRWQSYCGIFVPSSCWIGVDSQYGLSKLALEQLAKLYRLSGAHIVTDRIGYFPGEGIEPDRADEFFDMLVDADQIYARVMDALIPGGPHG